MQGLKRDMKISKTTLVISIIMFYNVSLLGQSKYEARLPDLMDSVSVAKYIRSTSTCEKLDFVLKKLPSFCNEEGYSSYILIDISKETHERSLSPLQMGV